MDRIDQFFVDRLDRLTAWGQKRRGWNLAAIRVWTVSLILFSSLFAAILTGGGVGVLIFISNGMLFGMTLLAEIVFFESNKDYAENQRICDHLNALATYHRTEHAGPRKFMIVLYPIIILPNIITLFFSPKPAGLLMTIYLLAIFVYAYLRCCYYLGPGQHSKEKKEVFNHDMVFDQTT